MAYTIDSDAEKPPQQKPSGRVQRAWLLGEAAAVAAIPRTKRNQDSKKEKNQQPSKAEKLCAAIPLGAHTLAPRCWSAAWRGLAPRQQLS